MKKIVVAVDSFKGSLNADGVCEAIKKAFVDSSMNYNVELLPISDGGENMTRILLKKGGGKILHLDTFDPLMRPINVLIGLFEDVAVFDMAICAGLTLLSKEEQDPMKTTTYGVGVIIKDLLQQGYRKFFIGLGGSATNDAGLGMLQALGVQFYDKNGNVINKSITGAMLSEISKLEVNDMIEAIGSSEIRIASDVKNILTGTAGAAYVYAEQKGASKENVKKLDEGLCNIRNLFNREFKKDADTIVGSGAAGGMGASFAIVLNAKIESGIDCILDILKFDDIITDADLIITGEGCVDVQSLMGKTLSGILSRCIKNNIPLLVIGGKIKNGEDLKINGVTDYIEVTPKGMAEKYFMNPEIAYMNIYNSIKTWISLNAKN